MQTVTLQINDNVFDKFQWLISHFSKNEIDIVNTVDTTHLSLNDFDYISNEQMLDIQKSSTEYKNGNKKDFEEYVV